MPKFRIFYSGSVDIEAEDLDHAIDGAWIEHAVACDTININDTIILD